MRAITKGPEPASLTAHRKTPSCDYDNYTEKAELRQALASEQRGLCCYCMGRIHSETSSMKIEHWRCQALYPGEQLNYRNLLGVCLGGEGLPWKLQHCDTRKGDREFRWNPADPAHHIETRLGYQMDGTIFSVEADFNEQLQAVLNLNLERLKNQRKGILTGILDWWKSEKARLRGPVSRARFERERARLIEGTGNLAPYCQVAVWWLEKRLQRMAG